MYSLNLKRNIKTLKSLHIEQTFETQDTHWSQICQNPSKGRQNFISHYKKLDKIIEMNKAENQELS